MKSGRDMDSVSKSENQSLLKLFASEIRIEQTLFSLPFVFLGALLGNNFFLTWNQIFLIIIAAASARALGMLINRIIDRAIDKLNPRTSSRYIASGEMKTVTALALALVCLVIYLICAYLLGPLPLKLSSIPVILFVLYPYSKRFTWLCHFFLGITLSMAPLAGWIAVSEELNFTPFLLTIAVCFWVAGFDIYYATLDMEFDKTHMLHSLPVRFGTKISAMITAFSHVITAVAILLVGLQYGLGAIYFMFAVISSLYLLYIDYSYLNYLGTYKINEYIQKNSYFSIIVFHGVIFEMIYRKVM